MMTLSDADKDLHFLVKDKKSLEKVNTFSPFFERNQIMSESNDFCLSLLKHF